MRGPATPSVVGSAPASAYRAALDAAARVLQRRARYFRKLAVAVGVLCIASLGWALGTRSPAGAAGLLLLLVPACGVFFVADARLLDDWRATVLAAWARRDIDLAAFRAALRANPALPKDTTEAMLATLPSAGDLVTEQRTLAPTRLAVAAACNAAHRGHADALLLATVASAVATGAIASALWARSWSPLAALAALATLPLARAALRRRHRVERDAVVGACREEAGFDDDGYARLLATLR